MTTAGERRYDREAAGHRRRSLRRWSAHSSEGPIDRRRLARADSTGSSPSARKPPSKAADRCSFSRAARPCLATREPHVELVRRSAGSSSGSDDRADEREALLPRRILNDDRHDLPAPCRPREPDRVGNAAPRKSEITKTNVPEESSLRKRARNSRPRATHRPARRSRRPLPALSICSTSPTAARRRASTARRRAPGARESRYATGALTRVALATIDSIAARTAAGFESHGNGGGYSAIDGRRSHTTTTRGASSA